MPDGPRPIDRVLDVLTHRFVVAAVILVNLGGILYGFYYYIPQFAATPAWLWPLVPDSPMAVLLATSALALLLAKRDTPLWNLVAMTAMVKVGVWTAVILAWFPTHFGFQFVPGGLDCSGTGLNFRCADLNTWLFYLHLGMAAEAVILARRYPTGWRPYAWTAAAFVAIDAIDYFWPADFTGRGCNGVFPYTVPCDHHLATFAVTAFLSVATVFSLWLLSRWIGPPGHAEG